MSNQAESSGPNLAGSMPSQAAEFAQVCKGKGINLDYLPRTLPLVDRFLQGVRGEVQQLTAKQDPQAPELQNKNASPGMTTRTGRCSIAATTRPTR
jgi:hypothetical protein